MRLTLGTHADSEHGTASARSYLRYGAKLGLGVADPAKMAMTSAG